jgi:hypothetical protein
MLKPEPLMGWHLEMGPAIVGIWDISRGPCGKGLATSLVLLEVVELFEVGPSEQFSVTGGHALRWILGPWSLLSVSCP